MNNNIITYDLLIWIGLLITIISQMLVIIANYIFSKLFVFKSKKK